MSPLRVVFFGSPDYALPTLRGLLATPDIEVVAVVSQPARPRGRSGTAAPTPVAALAAESGIVTRTPERITRAVTAALTAFTPDVGVLAASGHILPEHLLDAFPHGVLNVHASLLPWHRGASPVAAAILEGDAETGATIMRVVRALDAGPVLARAVTRIEALETTGTLTNRIAELGASALLGALAPWVRGDIEATPQDESLVTYAPKLTKADGVLDWTTSADALWRRVRAFHPWPLATATYAGAPLTIHEAWPLASSPSGQAGTGTPPGTVVRGDGSPLTPLLPGRTAQAVVACGEGALALLRVQRPGKRALPIEEYLRGNQAFIGARLG